MSGFRTTARRLRALASALIAFCALLGSAALPAATVPTGFSDSTVVTGLASPTAMEIAPDGRIFVSQQSGALRVIKNGTLLPTPFLTVSVNSSGERGLLGVVFDPNFASNRYLYVYYTTASSPIHNRVSRFTASTANPDVAEAGETVLLDLGNLSATNHNGGALRFGADGKLYIAAGENAVGSNSQSMNNLLGKVLRLNPDGTIPTDNPFYGSATGDNRSIWAIGLRNPFTFAIQPGTGRMLINDVGENTWEEIDLGVAGANYGWPTSEGPVNCTNVGFTCPIYSYDHRQGGCAITGGVFYNPANQTFPALYAGKYFFAEYCGNWIKYIDPDAPPATGTAPTFATGISSPVDLRVGSDGSLYYLARGAGAVGRIQHVVNQPPSITLQPSNRTVPTGATATFTVSAAGSPPLLYQWQRNQIDITGANSATLSVPNVQAADNGALFRCEVVNDFGSAFSDEAQLTVTADNPPTSNITQPVGGAHYNAGQTVSYSGTASDGEDPSIPASGFTWQVDFHHDQHAHPFIAPFSGVTSGTFLIPNTGETATNVWYRIYLTVRDSRGLAHTSFRDILPNTSTISLASDPPGLQLTLDAQPVTAPVSAPSVVGMLRAIGTSSPQGGTSYHFASWSDAGTMNHTITTPAANTTYTATFSVAPVNGNGLTGAYYPRRDLTGTAIPRIDPVLAFDWGKAAPLPGIPSDNFSVRWTGQVQPQFSGATTFYAAVDDGVRLWVNDVLVIDRWVPNAGEPSGTIALTGGQQYAIRMEYFEKTNRASARLSWSSSNQPKQVIPQARLYSQ